MVKKRFTRVQAVDVKTDKFNGGAPFSIFYNQDPNLIGMIATEIFENEYYKQVLEHCVNIDNPVILDVGAHIGLASVYFASLGKGTIHSIEPNIYNFECLIANTKHFKNVRHHPLAIGGITSKRKLYSSTKDDMSESLYNKGPHALPVTAVSLKDFMKENKIDHIDAMKMDVEGSEYEIFLLPDFKEIAGKIDFIIGEAHYKPGIPPMIYDLLKPLGFQVEFLPYANLTESYAIKFPDGKEHKVTTELSTMFTAKRLKVV